MIGEHSVDLGEEVIGNLGTRQIQYELGARFQNWTPFDRQAQSGCAL